MALVNELKLDKEEVEAGKQRMKSMLKVYREKLWTKDEIQHHFEQWKLIATRLKKGGEMLDNMKAVRPESQEHFEKMNSLYTYLMKMLGMYDALFKFMFVKNESAYIRAREQIIAYTK